MEQDDSIAYRAMYMTADGYRAGYAQQDPASDRPRMREDWPQPMEMNDWEYVRRDRDREGSLSRMPQPTRRMGGYLV